MSQGTPHVEPFSQGDRPRPILRSRPDPSPIQTQSLYQQTGPAETESDLLPTPSPLLKNELMSLSSPIKKHILQNFVNEDNYNYKYFKKKGDQNTNSEPIRSPSKKTNATAYRKLSRCLLAAHACTQFQTELWKVRKYGTSSNQYKIPLRGKKNVKEKLLWEYKEISAQEIIKKEKYLISPFGIPYLAWNFFMALLILYAMTFMPYGLVFMGDDNSKELAENLMNIFFVIDIFVNFFSAYFDDDGQ